MCLIELVASSTTKESVEDRSKADGFTKAFACVQSAWLIIQSIARVAAGLSHHAAGTCNYSTGFVICALAMYILWWDKPFDVETWDKSITPRPWWVCEGRVPEISWITVQRVILSSDYFWFDPGSHDGTIAIGLYATAMLFSAIARHSVELRLFHRQLFRFI